EDQPRTARVPEPGRQLVRPPLHHWPRVLHVGVGDDALDAGPPAADGRAVKARGAALAALLAALLVACQAPPLAADGALDAAAAPPGPNAGRPARGRPCGRGRRPTAACPGARTACCGRAGR